MSFSLPRLFIGEQSIARSHNRQHVSTHDRLETPRGSVSHSERQRQVGTPGSETRYASELTNCSRLIVNPMSVLF
jgi:hypothetical protein